MAKYLKTTVIVVASGTILGGLVFGTDMLSYVKCSARSVQHAVKDSVPIEFELKRARDLLEEIIPEMHANIKLIAQEEVEIAALKADIETGSLALGDEEARIKKLTGALTANQAVYHFGHRQFSRTDIKADLAARFERYKEAEIVHASKVKLLNTREQSLRAAMGLLEQTKGQKRLLEDKISTLAGKYRVIKAASAGSNLALDNSKLAQTEKLIDQINKRLAVAERVLAHESKFVQSIPVDVIEESDLIAQIDTHFNPLSQEEGIEVSANTEPVIE